MPAVCLQGACCRVGLFVLEFDFGRSSRQIEEHRADKRINLLKAPAPSFRKGVNSVRFVACAGFQMAEDRR
jgi:hypothetical protein